MAEPELTSDWAKNVALVPPSGIVAVIEVKPAAGAVVESSKLAGLLLVNNTETPPAGAGWPIATVQLVSRFCPIVVPVSQEREKP